MSSSGSTRNEPRPNVPAYSLGTSPAERFILATS